MPQDIDLLAPKKSLIDLTAIPKNSFNSVFHGFALKSVYDDTILVKVTDEGQGENTILRGGLHVPVNADSQAWRIGEVVLVGPNVKQVKEGDHVLYPNNLGVPIANVELEGKGSVGKAIFLNEQRIFGVLSPLDENSSADA